MNNIMRIVNSGACTGCYACDICEHISFIENQYGFYAPVVDEQCSDCGKCLKSCIYDPYKTDNDD